MKCGTSEIALTMKIIEGHARVKEIDETVAHLLAKRKRYTDWLEKHKDVKLPDLPAGKPEMTDEAYSEEFESLWKLYPSRNGVKAEKKAAFRKFKNLKKIDKDALKKAILNYAKGPDAKRGFARDMVRFLKEDYWPMWIHPSPAMLQNAKDKSHEQKGSSSKALDQIVAETTGAGGRSAFPRG